MIDDLPTYCNKECNACIQVRTEIQLVRSVLESFIRFTRMDILGQIGVPLSDMKFKFLDGFEKKRLEELEHD